MIKLLLVDDESSLLEIGKIFIERTGDFTVDTASSADEALSKLRDKTCSLYEVVVSDYEMPGKNGIEFLKELRANKNSIPFLIFTGRGREDVVVEAIESGADYYVQKGGSPKPQFAELTYKIKKAVEKRKADENQAMDNLRLKSINAILHRKDVFFKDILFNIVWDGLRLSESSLGYAVLLNKSGVPETIFCCTEKIKNQFDLKTYSGYSDVYSNFFSDYINSLKSPCVENQTDIINPFSALLNDEIPTINRYLAVPVSENDRAVMLAFFANKKRPYSDLDKRQIELFTMAMWMIAGRKRTEEELTAAYEQLKASDDIMQSQILKLKESEQKLKKSEESLSLAIEGAGLGIWDSDIITKKQVVNEKWASMLGYTCEEVDNVPNFWREHVHPADLPHVLKNIEACSLRNRDNYHSEFRMKCKDGSWKWIASTGKISDWDENNRPARISGIHRDITDLTTAEKPLI